MATGPLIGGLLAAIPASSQADEPIAPDTPGLPHIVCNEKQELLAYLCKDGDGMRNLYGWANFTQIGLTGSIPAKQWGRIPLTMVSANVLVYQTDINLSADPGELLYKYPIPVETIHENYANDSDGYSRTIVAPSFLDQMVSIRVRSVAVDRVDVRLRDTCQTGPLARLHAESDNQELVLAADGSNGSSDDNFDPDTGFFGINGGTLNGTIDILAFSGCATQSGDDLSRLLTSAVSSESNPVTLRVGALACYTSDGVSPRPTSPGANTPDKAGCVEVNNPNNPKIRTIPYPLDIPTHAPGAHPGR